ncbi:hypothetical protein HDV00_012092, partial [Rhizophlyctis rosea]
MSFSNIAQDLHIPIADTLPLPDVFSAAALPAPFPIRPELTPPPKRQQPKSPKQPKTPTKKEQPVVENHEASTRVRQALKVSSTNPAAAAVLFWTAATTHWTTPSPHTTLTTLQHLITLLTSPISLQITPENLIPPNRHASTLFQARLAIARIYALYGHISQAARWYVEALDGRYKGLFSSVLLGTSEENLLDVLDVRLVESNVPHLLSRAEDALLNPDAAIWLKAKDTEASRQKFVGFLEEVDHVLDQDEDVDDSPTVADVTIAVKLLRAVMLADSDRKRYEADVWRALSETYKSLNSPFNTLGSLIFAGDAHLKHQDTTNALTRYCEALINALQYDDLVAAQRIEHKIQSVRGGGDEVDGFVGGNDVQFLLALSLAYRTLDHAFLSDEGGGYWLDVLSADDGMDGRNINLTIDVADLKGVWDPRGGAGAAGPAAGRGAVRGLVGGRMRSGGMVQINVDEGEMRGWKEVLPGLAERVRVGELVRGGWEHERGCAYRKVGAPVSVEYGRSSFCGCVGGKGIDERVRGVLGGARSLEHFVRIGAGLMFAVDERESTVREVRKGTSEREGTLRAILAPLRLSRRPLQLKHVPNA